MTTIEPTTARLWTRDYLLDLLVAHCIFASYGAMYTLIPLYVIERGGADWQIGLVIGSFGIVGLVVRPFAGQWIYSIGAKTDRLHWDHRVRSRYPASHPRSRCVDDRAGESVPGRGAGAVFGGHLHNRGQPRARDTDAPRLWATWVTRYRQRACTRRRLRSG